METNKHIYMPDRFINSNKSDYGKLSVIGGSVGMSGAVCLSSMAALKTGAGLVTAYVPASINPYFECNVIEAMSVPVPDHNGMFFSESENILINAVKNSDVTAIGMGMGRNADCVKILARILKEGKSPLIIDADALFALQDIIDLISVCSSEIILTPHEMEFSRISGYTVDYIRKNRLDTATEFAEKHNVTVVLKGHNTVVTNGKDTYVNDTGNNGMSTPGSGDVLSGVISALVAQKMNIFDAACTGVYLHGLSGDIAAKKLNVYSITASDILENIPYAINCLTNKGE